MAHAHSLVTRSFREIFQAVGGSLVALVSTVVFSITLPNLGQFVNSKRTSYPHIPGARSYAVAVPGTCYPAGTSPKARCVNVHVESWMFNMWIVQWFGDGDGDSYTYCCTMVLYVLPGIVCASTYCIYKKMWYLSDTAVYTRDTQQWVRLYVAAVLRPRRWDVEVVVVFTLKCSFYPTLAVHPVSVLIHPREIQILWSQTTWWDRKTKISRMSQGRQIKG